MPPVRCGGSQSGNRTSDGEPTIDEAGDRQTGSGADPTADRRFPRRVFDVGSEPDPRFSLANERTFLAWIRTALALTAAGVALEALAVPVAPGLRLASALLLIALGVLAPVQAWLGWTATERAMRTGRPLPPPRMAPVLAAGAVVAGALLSLGLLLR